jgi:3-oxoacyl-[acyl-carrier protein] reductase
LVPPAQPVPPVKDVGLVERNKRARMAGLENGIHGLKHSYAALLAKEGITVNAIAPALIETEMVTSNPLVTPALILVGRFGTMDEVADAVALLATNGYITGQTINVNGGCYMS